MRRIVNNSIALITTLGVMVSATAASAAPLVVTAGLYFRTPFSRNYFDPAYGYVPANSANSKKVKTTVTIAPGNDRNNLAFSYKDGANSDDLLLNFDKDLSLYSFAIFDYGKYAAYSYYVLVTANQPIFANYVNPFVQFDDFYGTLSITGGGRTMMYYSPAIDHAANRAVGFQAQPDLASLAASKTSSGLASLTDPSAVPEPATWAMMITGFGFVGAALRRRGGRRRVQAIA